MPLIKFRFSTVWLLVIGAMAIAMATTTVGDEGETVRRSAEGDGPRRNAEPTIAQTRTIETDGGPRRSAEGERGPSSSGEGRSSRETQNALKGFKPQTERETALYQMILQLQRELAQLRQDIGLSDVQPIRTVGRSARSESAAADGWERTKAGGVFKAYDKNGDKFVSLDEWLAMTNGNISPARRQLQTQRFRETQPGADEKLSPAEFVSWWNNREGSSRSPRDGQTVPRRSAEGEAGPRRSADGEGQLGSSEAEAGPRRSSER